MSNNNPSLKRTLTFELTLLAGLLLVGLLVVPLAIFFVGEGIFGDYAGDGLGAFFAAVMQRLLSGDRVALFLVLSPYLAIQCLRITLLAWRLTAKPAGR